MIFGRNVRRFRRQRKLTQEELAFEAEIDLTCVGGIERGKRNPRRRRGAYAHLRNHRHLPFTARIICPSKVKE